MNKRIFIKNIVLGALAFSILTGCGKTNIEESKEPQKGTTSAFVNTTNLSSNEDYSLNITEDDYYFDWKSKNYTTIDLSQGSVNIEKSGIYEIIGTISEGTLTVNVDKSVDKDRVFLVFNGASISSEVSTPINIIEAKKVTIILENGTVNSIYQGNVVTDDENFPSAALFSKADLTITGGGTLNVSTKYNDGISSKDDLIITDGIFNIDAMFDGIVGKDVLAIVNGDFTIKAGKDGLKSTNIEDPLKGNTLIFDGTFKIEAENDGIDSANNIEISKGSFNVTTGGGYKGVTKQSNNMNRGGKGQMPNTQGAAQTASGTESKKGIKATNEISILSGTFNLSCYDDALHSNSNITVDGGTFIIESGDDAIHGDNTVVINNGDIDIINCYEGIEGLNVTINEGKISIISADDGINVTERTGTFEINGGDIFIKSGGDCIDSNGNVIFNQGVINVDTSIMNGPENSIDYDGTYSGTGETKITDQDGNIIDPSVRQSPGGGFGGKGQMPNDGQMPNGGQRPNKGQMPEMPSGTAPTQSVPQ